MTRPYRLRLVVPSDRFTANGVDPLDGIVNSPSGDYALRDGVAFLTTLAQRFNRWIAQSGYMLQFHVDHYLTPRTLLDLQSDGDDPTTGEWTDLDGEGLSFYKEPMLLNEGLQIERGADYSNLRLMQVVIGGGGYAGSNLTSAAEILNGLNVGHGAVGDVEFSPALTGNYDPWAIRQGGGTQLSTKNFGSALSHEINNTLGLDSYSEQDFGGNSDHDLDQGGMDSSLWTPLAEGFALYPMATQAVPPLFPVVGGATAGDAIAAEASMRQTQATAAMYSGHVQQLRIYNAPFIKKIA